MLIMFKAKNFTSFKDEVFLDLRATSYKQHPSHVINAKKDLKLLKTTAVYGANASGKSNLISAMFFFEKYIFDQFISNSKNDDSILKEQQFKTNLEPFMLTNNVNDVSEFEIIFYYNNKQIQYGFECNSSEVLNEWYYIDDKKVFERNSTVSFGRKYENQLKMYTKYPKERLYISVLEYFLDEEAKNLILKDFINFFVKDYNVYLEIFFESSVKKVANNISLNKKLILDKDYRMKVEKYLKQIDVGIAGLRIEDKVVFNDETGKQENKKIIKTIHNVYDDSGNVIYEKYFDLFQESTGTLRFLSYIQNIVDMIEKGGVFIIDEMSARLHPLLTKFIVDMFQSSSNKGAQLIFTTHDISLLNKEQFRRDEVVFVDKDLRGVSHIYALSDLKVREDATFNKDYIQGKYGAIPIFKYNDIIGGEKYGEN
ncbi:MAG: ATP-binding protein [Clostridium sp.]|uniref:AAA family ATPase n=1 Tax=Clostridium sp. TaxID=1506 RepID=UPI0029095F9C|nr:ATP-binding protein [Clostridium sp.]MDU7253967.1 ATP-binding protein [Clostridium sp.]